MLRAQWSSDGKRIVVVFLSPIIGDKDKNGSIIVAPADAPEQAHLVARLPLDDLVSAALPEVDGKLYLGGDYLVRIDLATGKIDERKDKDGLKSSMLALSRKGIHVLQERRDNPQDHPYVLGMVDIENLTIKPLLTLKKDDVGDLYPCLAVSDDGSKTALIGKKILVIAGGKVAKTIPLKLPSENAFLSSMEWSRDGKTLYGTLLEKDPQTNLLACKLCEIAVDSGRVRYSPISTLGPLKDEDIKSIGLVLRGVLSPDGKTLALSTMAFSGDVDNKDRALFLVDLTSPQRTVTRIAPPTP